MNRSALALVFALAMPAHAQDHEAPAGAPARGPSPSIPAPKAAENRLLDLALAGGTLVAVGHQGVILRSQDARSWSQSNAPTSVMLNRVQFTDAQNGWVLGYDATILRTRDGGQTWTLAHQNSEARALYDLLFLDAQRALAVGGYGLVMESTDGGATWTAREDVLTGLGMHLNAITKLGDGSLLVVGERGLIARSTDAGATWSVLDSPYAGSLFGVLPRGERGALVYGMRGNVYTADDLATCPVLDPASWDPYTRETRTDAGQLATLGWQRIDSPVQESLFGAIALGEDRSGAALLIGVNGTALKLDGAATLRAVKTPAAETLSRGLVFKDRLLAVGRRGVVDLGAAR